MELKQYVNEHFEQSIELLKQGKNLLSDDIILAANIIVQSLMSDGKVLACGNGGSAADAQHFSAELVGRFEQERMGLAAIALTTDSSILTAISNDYDFDLIFSKQVFALGKKNDVLLAISTSGNSPNVIEAISAAHEKEIAIIAMTGNKGGKIAELLNANDILLNVPHSRTARIQEVHTLMIHAICDCIDKMLFGENNDLSL
ncbi:MAG: phosphoheptose isomerase [Neisseriaceae bacterium]|nr:phosphoheptose isomerase [Neisseriaceae bacterium PsAf]MCV2508959.1 phosphoheptose isomerase [Neisseriaceae bacterium]